MKALSLIASEKKIIIKEVISSGKESSDPPGTCFWYKVLSAPEFLIGGKWRIASLLFTYKVPTRPI